MKRSLGNLITEFLNQYEQGSQHTYKFYRTGLDKFQDFTDEWPVTAPTLSGFIEYCRELELADATTAAYYRCVRAFLNWCEDEGYLKDNPIDEVKKKRRTPRQPKRRIPRAPHRAEVEILLAYFEFRIEAALKLKAVMDHWNIVRDYAFISMTIDTGLRVSEVISLDFNSIDFTTRTIYVTGKGDKPRAVPFEHAAAADLKLWLDLRGRLNVPDELDAIFVTQYDNAWRRISLSRIEAMFKQRCGQAGLKPFGPHSLRHFYAGQKLAAGAGLNEVQQVLGHASPTTTAIYTRIHDEQIKANHRYTSPLNILRDGSDDPRFRNE